MGMKSFVRNLAASFLVVSVFYTAAACSSSGNTGSVAGDRDSFISQYCNEFMPCCAQVGKPTDGSQCRAFIGAFAPSTGYDAAAANKCLDEVRAASKSATFCQDGMSSNTAPSCQAVFAQSSGGTRKPGETCSEDDDCASSTEGQVQCQSLYTGGMTIKKCQVQVVGKAGDSPCVGTVDGNVTSYSSSGETEIPVKGFLCYVKDGLRCDSTTKACKAIPKIGEACESFGSNSCTKDAYCDSSTKLCVARKAVGATCDTFSSDQCAEGTYCNSTTKVCTTALAIGAACTTSQECGENRCVNGKCEKSGDLTTSFLCGG
jgi:hypothetical protein